MATEQKMAMVDEEGRFHCECGASHDRGPVNGDNAYRCLGCGRTFAVRGVAELRTPPPAPGSDATTLDGRFVSGAGYGGERM